MTLQVLIAEDEPILAATLAHALKRLWPEAELVATCAHGADALEKALALQPHVLFLDIKMPGMSGLEAAEELAEQWSGRAGKPFPQIVFVTAYDEYAVQAFEREAADYVLKPISDARLGKTIERLKARLSAPAPGGGLEALLGQMRALLPPAGPSSASAGPAPERLSMIRAAVGNQVRMIPVGEVVYFEALDKYVNVVTQDSEALIRMSLKELLPQLDDKQFWQVHRGTIVNSTCVQSALRDEAGKLSLQLKHRPERVRVSPLYAHLFRQM
ncbi:LytR family transcriptional regulator [Massilia sp. Root351]|jgi:DNA-binding LytR/AlgR family response regulator|uniref:LytR/AlgR family response regulator transcription factor n=1 Tax=Massilia sp. Root351 TaxID=1736522 RepID=UPI0007097682|nr:LytTR family DNA-binding domain-containing protein [Massilia sp. Root351]KQV85066.1 LytR family transcriptional regulator [Massilia sp. Root351]